MANLSTANGQFKIENGDKLTKEEITLLLKMMDNTLDGFGYNTTLDINVRGESVDIENFINEGYETPFYGSGKWTYSNNVTNTFEWVSDSLDDEEQNYKELINTLINKEIMFTFIYHDWEPCNNSDILSELYTIQPYYDDESNLKTKILEESLDELTGDAATLIELDFIEDYKTLEEMIDNKDEYFNNDEEMKEWLSENEYEFDDGNYVFVIEEDMFVLA